MNFGLSAGIIYVNALLKRIDIHKDMFIRDLMKGEPLIIPNDLG